MEILIIVLPVGIIGQLSDWEVAVFAVGPEGAGKNQPTSQRQIFLTDIIGPAQKNSCGTRKIDIKKWLFKIC